MAGMEYAEFKAATLEGIDQLRDSTQRINRIVSELKGFVRPGAIDGDVRTGKMLLLK